MGDGNGGGGIRDGVEKHADVTVAVTGFDFLYYFIFIHLFLCHLIVIFYPLFCTVHECLS